MKIILPFKPTPKQSEAIKSKARIKVLKWGRRTGKTWLIGYFLASNALRRKGKHWYVTRTLSLGREELWPVLLDLLPRHLVRKTNERNLDIWLTNGSVISIKSGEKEDNLRGRGLASVVLDEAAFLKERLWEEILRPQLMHSMGPALIASSPKKGWFTKLFRDSIEKPDPDWFASHATCYDNPTISPKEIESIKARTPVNTWKQEYMAEEIAEQGQVYAEFSARNIFDPGKHFLDVRTFPQVRGLDYGLKANFGASFIGISPEGYLVLHDEHVQNGWDVERHAKAILTRSAGLSVRGNCMDKSAFRTEGTSMTSVSKLLDKQGITCQPSEGDIAASTDIMRRFMNGNGEKPWLYVSSKCEKTIKAFQEWEHGDHEPDIAAGARYGCVWAVAKKLTKLYDAPAKYRHLPEAVYSKREAATILAQEARIVMTRRPKRFSWNSTTGVPI